ncbi:MAG: glycerophosphodiester phosphodiesterase [Thermoleophilaceae bacterium]
MPSRLVALVALAVLAPAGVAAAATPQIHAHRGGTVVNGKARYPEESLAAYKNAARNDFVLEVDAKLTEGGVPVAIHDATLGRTTNCTGEVRTFTLAELAGCRTDVLGSPGSPLPTKPAARPAPIVTIQSLLDYARRAGATVNLEIKNVPSDPDYDSTPRYANRVIDAVLASRIPRRQLIVQSFIPANLDVAAQRLPGVTTSLLSLQAINEAYLQVAFDNDYDIISPEWPVSADYVRRAHSNGLDVIPFTLDSAADVRAARAAKVDELITDDQLAAARVMGLRPARFFDATVFIDGSRMIAVVHLLGPRCVSARQTCRGALLMRVMITGRRTQQVRRKLNRNCEARFGIRRTPPRLGPPTVTVLFEGNARVLPALDGPKVPLLKPPSFNP